MMFTKFSWEIFRVIKEGLIYNFSLGENREMNYLEVVFLNRGKPLTRNMMKYLIMFDPELKQLKMNTKD